MEQIIVILFMDNLKKISSNKKNHRVIGDFSFQKGVSNSFNIFNWEIGKLALFNVKRTKN